MNFKKKHIRKFLSAILSAVSISSIAYAAPATEKIPLGQDVSSRFVGTVHRNDLILSEDVYKVPQANIISFEAGSHSGWHVHGGMTVIGVSGTGIYQEYGKAPILIRQGDVVQIPAGTSHWHGSTKDSSFRQIVIYDKDWKAPENLSAHTGPLTDDEYNHIEPVEAADTTSRPRQGIKTMFNYPDKPFTSPNFTSSVYVSKVVTKQNAANSPEWTYVVFPNGAYNRWHSHKTGQILLATDGLGYHQIKGEKPQLLHPGDVVYCPPGVIHWHGAAPGSDFAHISVNPQDNHDVTWYDFPYSEYSQLNK